MKLQKIFENEFSQIKLVKVRLKSDPANNKIPYEGYILRENEDGTMEIMLIAPEMDKQTMSVGMDGIDNCCSATNVDKLKKCVGEFVENDSILELIQGLETASDIDSMLISNGMSYEDLYKIYKNYYLTSEGTIVEGLLSSIGKGYRNLEKASRKLQHHSTGPVPAWANTMSQKIQALGKGDLGVLGDNEFNRQSKIKRKKQLRKIDKKKYFDDDTATKIAPKTETK